MNLHLATCEEATMNRGALLTKLAKERAGILKDVSNVPRKPVRTVFLSILNYFYTRRINVNEIMFSKTDTAYSFQRKFE